MKQKLLKILACPRCGGDLAYIKKSRELKCPRDKLCFPVRNGVPILLEMDARPVTDNNNASG